MKEAIVYLLAIVIAEVITALFPPPLGPILGVVGHIVILILLIVHPAIDVRYPHRPLPLSLSLVPLVRIISLSMPLANVPQIWWYPIIYAPLLAAAVIVMRFLNYRPEQVGLTFKWSPLQLAVVLTGIVFGVVEYFILKPEGMIAELSWQAMWLPALILLVCTGFVEELIFRGVLQRAAVKALRWWGVIYVSLLFAVLHVGFLSWLDVVFVFGVALFFGWVVQKTGSLFGVTLAHGVTNIMLFVILPFFL